MTPEAWLSEMPMAATLRVFVEVHELGGQQRGRPARR